MILVVPAAQVKPPAHTMACPGDEERAIQDIANSVAGIGIRPLLCRAITNKADLELGYKWLIMDGVIRYYALQKLGWPVIPIEDYMSNQIVATKSRVDECRAECSSNNDEPEIGAPWPDGHMYCVWNSLECEIIHFYEDKTMLLREVQTDRQQLIHASEFEYFLSGTL